MKMKKIIALLLSATMVASMAVGCGKKEGGDKPAGNGDNEKVLKLAAFEGGNGKVIWEKSLRLTKKRQGLKLNFRLLHSLTKTLQRVSRTEISRMLFITT